MTLRRETGRRRWAAAHVALIGALLLGTGLAPTAAVAAPDDERGLVNGELAPGHLLEAGGVLLAPNAAQDMARLIEAASADGVRIRITDGYRSYERQVELKERKGWLAARPGTSKHGWGLAVDFDTRFTDFAWLRAHAATYGWFHPEWAQPGGSKPEPWHWEYAGEPGHEAAITTPVEPGTLLARARFEHDGGAGAWFEVREGPGSLDGVALRYPGTADPGGPGNLGIAGYQYERGAPLAGLARLRPGDAIALEAADGELFSYEVIGASIVSQDDTWALHPDPLGMGSARMLTMTTSAGDGLLRVVWASLD